MNIVVTIKQVEDPIIPPTHLVVDGASQRVRSASGAPQVMNGYDANALEEALRIKERLGGKVTVIGLADESARKTLKRAIAMGADSAVLLSDPQWESLDSQGIARVLAAAVRKIGKVDLVLCGRQASDSDGGQVLYWLAGALALPVVSPVIRIEEAQADSLLVQRILEEEYQRLAVRLPALLGVSSEINEPRLPTPKGTVAATRAMIPVWKAATLNVPRAERQVTMRKLDIQLRAGRAEIIQGTDAADAGRALADKLHQQGLI